MVLPCALARQLLGHLGRRAAPVALAGAATDGHHLQDVGQTGGQTPEDDRARVLERNARSKLPARQKVAPSIERGELGSEEETDYATTE